MNYDHTLSSMQRHHTDTYTARPVHRVPRQWMWVLRFLHRRSETVWVREF